MLDLEDSLTLNEENMVYDLNEAPYDIFGEHNMIGTIVVAKKGAELPLTTSWKISEGVPVAAKSRYFVPTINFEYNRLKLQVPIELMMMGLR